MAIVIGGSADLDLKELFSGKPLAEIMQPGNCLYLESYEQLDRLLSPARMDLLRYLMASQSGEKPKSVSEIARALKRHQEAVSRDVNYLKARGLVALKRVKQTVYAMPAFSEIEIRIC
ncbi:MAG: helix-turn-helix domain-containing protein [Candidatus Diapherotrites archaeon]